MSDLLNVSPSTGHGNGDQDGPCLPNIFMAELEEGLLRNYHTTPILWKRYIDDVLCIWPGPPDSLKEFIRSLNGSHRTIKFTYECSETTVDFLDVTIYKGKGTTIQAYQISNLFSKRPTSSNTWNTPPPTPETHVRPDCSGPAQTNKST